MKSVFDQLEISTKKRREVVNITDNVKEKIKKSGVKNGLCFVNSVHTTTAILVNVRAGYN